MQLNQNTKTALWIGGAAIAVGAAIVLWSKQAKATAIPSGGAPSKVTEKATIDDPTKWTLSSTLEPGSIYMVASMPPVGVAIDRLTLASLLQGMNWSNGSVLYAPGEDLSGWPKAIPQLADQSVMKNMYVVVGTWGGAPGTVIPAGTNTMPLRYTP